MRLTSISGPNADLALEHAINFVNSKTVFIKISPYMLNYGHELISDDSQLP